MLGTLHCRICGEELNLQNYRNINEKLMAFTCLRCGHHLLWSETEEEQEEPFARLYEKTRVLRESGAFEEAENGLRRILEVDDDQIEAYRGIALCRYGVRYLRPDGKIRPTMERHLDQDFTADSAFLTALEKAGKQGQKFLLEEGEELDRLLETEEADRLPETEELDPPAEREETDRLPETEEKLPVVESSYENRLDAQTRREVDLLRNNAAVWIRLEKYDQAMVHYRRLRENYPGVYDGWMGMILCRTEGFSRADVDQEELNDWMRCAGLLAEGREDFSRFRSRFIAYKRSVYETDLQELSETIRRKKEAVEANIIRMEQEIRLIEADRKVRIQAIKEEQEACDRWDHRLITADEFRDVVNGHRLPFMGTPIMILCFLFLTQLIARPLLIAGAVLLLVLFVILPFSGRFIRKKREDLKEQRLELGKLLMEDLEETQAKIDRRKLHREELEAAAAKMDASLKADRMRLELQFLQEKLEGTGITLTEGDIKNGCA